MLPAVSLIHLCRSPRQLDAIKEKTFIKCVISSASAYSLVDSKSRVFTSQVKPAGNTSKS